jgi:hypothetical protein
MDSDKLPYGIEPLYTGELVAREVRGFGADASSVAGAPPVVTIGVPQLIGELRTMAGPKPDAATRALLDQGDFYLLKFACSLRGDRPIDNAHFRVALDDDLIAYDLFPLRIDVKASKDVKVSLSPNLKFGAVDVGTGSIDVGYSYDELRPTITSEGLQESYAGWTFRSAPGYTPAGSQVMYMVVKAPLGTRTGNANLSLDATFGGSRWRLILTGADAGPDPAQLRATLWKK